ncbi:hypothetical protein GIB67_000874, partial [Kingdonia uniflora]
MSNRRYRTILISSILYVMGLGLLTISALLPSSTSPELRIILFFSSLYISPLVKVGTSRACRLLALISSTNKTPRRANPRAHSLTGGFWTMRSNKKLERHSPPSAIVVEEATESYPTVGGHQFKFSRQSIVNKFRLFRRFKEDWKVCTIDQVEEAKSILRLVPIWATCLIYAVVFAQSSTFFTKQGNTMDRSIGSNIKVPAATLQTFITALVEKRRLQVALDFGLLDLPKAVIPMKAWWLIPQYILFELQTSLQ